MDTLSGRELWSGPGMDPRQWASYGTVDDDQPDQRAVTFDPDFGPLVSVTLQPSGIPVRCRVASWCGGNGEAEYAPFVSADEVLVVIPEGDERAAPAIVGRMNNQIDRFPTTVGGQDVTRNSVAFRRLRCPYVVESADSILLRAATLGNFLLIEKNGNVTVASGTKDFAHVGADFVGLQATNDDGSPRMILQLDKVNGVATVEVPGKGKLTVGEDGEVSWVASGAVSMSAGGFAATEHLATVEGLANVVSAVLIGLGALSAPGALAPLATPATAQALVAAAMGVASTSPLLPPTLAAVRAALKAKVSNGTALLPGVGAPNLFGG